MLGKGFNAISNTNMMFCRNKISPTRRFWQNPIPCARIFHLEVIYPNKLVSKLKSFPEAPAIRIKEYDKFDGHLLPERQTFSFVLPLAGLLIVFVLRIVSSCAL